MRLNPFKRKPKPAPEPEPEPIDPWHVKLSQRGKARRRDEPGVSVKLDVRVRGDGHTDLAVTHAIDAFVGSLVNIDPDVAVNVEHRLDPNDVLLDELPAAQRTRTVAAIRREGWSESQTQETVNRLLVKRAVRHG